MNEDPNPSCHKNNKKRGRGRGRRRGQRSSNQGSNISPPHSTIVPQEGFRGYFEPIRPQPQNDRYEHNEPTVVQGWQYMRYAQTGDRYSYIGKDEETGEPEFVDHGPKTTHW